MARKDRQATLQQQGGKGNIARAPHRMTDGFDSQRRTLPDYCKPGRSKGY